MAAARTIRTIFWVSAALVFLGDQITKALIRANLEPGDSVGIITRVENTGVAFGMFRGANWLFALLAVAVIVFLVLRRAEFSSAAASLGAGLVLGGAGGNLFDRLLFGTVTDFVSIGWWPAFNIADAALTVGIAVLILFWKR